jgi:hypothetical protein
MTSVMLIVCPHCDSIDRVPRVSDCASAASADLAIGRST